jgi:hypothetical protein
MTFTYVRPDASAIWSDDLLAVPSISAWTLRNAVIRVLAAVHTDSMRGLDSLPFRNSADPFGRSCGVMRTDSFRRIDPCVGWPLLHVRTRTGKYCRLLIPDAVAIRTAIIPAMGRSMECICEALLKAGIGVYELEDDEAMSLMPDVIVFVRR